MKKYTLVINMSYFSPTHLGGKDETAFNLLSGFEEMGVSKDIMCLCSKNMVNVIRLYAPSVHTCAIPQLYFHGFKIKGMNHANRMIRSLYEKYWIEKNKKDIEVFLFPNKPTSPWKYDIPTVVIPHDIQIFLAHEIPGIYYTERGYRKDTASILRDFKIRDHIVAISDYDRSEMIRFMPWAEHKIKRIYDPIYFDKMGSGTVHGGDYITALNIQWPHKNAETLIRAYALIADKITQKLILVGKKPDNISQLNKLITEFGLSKRIIFTGFISTEKLDKIVKKTRIYINASYFEGFGMTAVEMMGRGIPTIVAKNTAQPEATRELCYYYEPADCVSALADTIIEELQNPMPEEKLQLIAAEMRKYYSHGIIAKEYWNFILDCAKKK